MRQRTKTGSPVEAHGAMARSDGVVGVGIATRDYRAGLMRELMDREQVDALAFTSPDYFKFATNFTADVSGFERPGMCVIPRNGSPFVILHELSTNNWRFGTEAQRLWASDATFYSEHPRVRQRLALASQWSDMVAAKLEEVGLHRARIGTDGAPLAGVAQLLPHLYVEGLGRQCQRLRWVKHEEELAVMRQAAALADWTQERYRENIRPGRLVAELDMSMASLMAQEAARRMPGTDLAIYCWTLSGPVSASPHGAGSPFGNLAGATIEKGHVLVNCVYPAIDGLFVENERTWFCGTPSKRQIQLFEAARIATEAACEAAIVGQPVWSIDAAAQDVFERAGVANLIGHRTGHGLGLGGHDYPVDMAFNSSPMLENMVFSVEPGVYEFGLGGFRHDDTVVVGTRPDILTKTAKDLRSQTIA
jgi:Xaa-Pro aminopeptidase